MFSIVFEFNTVSSTMDIAHRMVTSVKGDFIVWAKKQIAGRGRGNRKWFSPEGGLWLSIVLKSLKILKHHQLLTLSSAFAVHDVLSKYIKNVWIKWPNDLMVGVKKIAGILLDVQYLGEEPQYGIIGIGVNINNQLKGTFLEEIAVSLYDLTGEIHPLKGILNEIIRAINVQYNKLGTKPWYIVKEFENRSRMVRKRIKILFNNNEIEGICEGIDIHGNLIIKEGNNLTRVIDIGDITKMELEW